MRKYLIIPFLSLLIILFPGISFGQIKGIVIDNQTRYPVPDASVILFDTTIIFTDNNGAFELPFDSIGMIEINHIGYVSKKQIVNPGKYIVFELTPDIRNIHEVSVISSTYSHKLRNEAASIGLILPRDITEATDNNMAAIFNTQPGVFMQNGNYNTNRLVIRGIGSRNPYGTNRIKAYLNDIPITGGDGETVIEDLPVTNIGRIELLKGSASAIYGAGLGGSIRIMTRYPLQNGYHAQINVRSGSFAPHDISVSNSYKRNNVALTGFIGTKTSDGYRDNSNYNSYHALISGNIFTHKTDIDLFFNYIRLKAFIPSSLNEEMYRSQPYAAAENWLKIRGYEQYDKINTGMSMSYNLTQFITHKTILFGGYKDLHELRPFNILKNKSKNAGIRSIVDVKFTQTQISFGIEYFIENIHWQTSVEIPDSTDNVIDNIRELRSYHNIFLRLNHKVTNRVNTYIGLNVNTLKYELLQSSHDNYPAGSYTFKPVLSPGMGLNYQLKNNIHIYASLNHGFSSPSFEETLLPDGTRNDHLKPEEGWTIETGIKGDIINQYLRFDISYYAIFVKNLIVTQRLSEEVFTGINAGKSYHTGIEISTGSHLWNKEIHPFEVYIGTGLNITANTFKDFIDNETDYSGKQLPGIPAYKMNLELRWYHRSGLHGGISFIKTGMQYVNDSNTVQYKGYQILNSNISYSGKWFNKISCTVSFGVNNIFNEHYASMLLINAPALNENAPRYYYPGNPRNYYISLVINL